MQPNTVRIYLAFAFAAWSTVSFQAMGFPVMGFPVMGSANANAAEAINFDRDIRPILSDHCFTCHGPDNNKRQAGLRLDQKEAAFSPVESGDTAIVAGQVGSSELIHRITSTDDSLVMPPPGEGKPLSKSQVELLSRWISEGATWSNHWAFEPVKTPTVPVDNLAAGSVAFIAKDYRNHLANPKNDCFAVCLST
jgi:mono/diheme cytochrome c family protein